MKKQNSGEILAEAARRYIEAHSKERFSLEQLSGALYVDKSYLSRIFRRYTRMTPLGYHHLVRCEKAKEMLLQTDKSISEIGEMAGFVSAAHFSHIFRRTEGCTPGEYRLSHRSGKEKEKET